MKQYFRTFVLAVLAGMAIGIGGVVFLSDGDLHNTLSINRMNGSYDS